jgi:hypothetical protein
VYSNYTWDKIKFWANSIDQSGFTGDKMVIIYNTDANSVNTLMNKGFKIYGFNRETVTGNLFFKSGIVVVVRRFLDLWSFFSTMDLTQYRYVIHTDVKDVIFQTNPSDWLTDNMGDAKILASCESLHYQHEPWGKENLYNSFPHIYETLKDKPIWNCGVQAGDPIIMKDLWLTIYNMCMGNIVHNPDQAAYNVLLNSEPYKSMTKFAMSEDGFSAQLGTTIDPTKIKNFLPHLLEAQPIWKDDYVCTSTGVKHAIVHQYDRIPNWRSIIEARYS